MIQTVTYDEIDAIFYEYIRRKLVTADLLPDQKLYTNSSDWKAAREAFIADKGSITDIFGVGLSESRDEKTYNRIVVDRGAKNKASWGGSGTSFYEAKSGNLFDKKAYPDTNYKVKYTVRVVAHSTKYDRILCNILDNWLPARNYCNTIDLDLNETNKKVLVLYQSDYRIMSNKFVERVYQYSVEDVWLTEPKVITADIPELTQVVAQLWDDNKNQKIIDLDILPLPSED